MTLGVPDHGIPAFHTLVADVAYKIEQDSSIWKGGITPLVFNEFFEALDGSPMTAHQYKVFQRMGMLAPYSWISPDRVLQEIILEWGKGTLAAYEVLTDVVTGESHTVEDWCANGKAITVNSFRNGPVAMQAGNVFCKGKANVWNVVLADGRHVTVSADHKFLTVRGWVKLKDLLVGSDELLCTQPHDPSCERSYRSIPDFQSGCHTLSRSCDALLRRPEGACQDAVQSPAHALALGLGALLDDRGNEPLRNCRDLQGEIPAPKNFEDAYQPLAHVGDGESFLLETHISAPVHAALDLYCSLPLEAKQRILGSFDGLRAARHPDEWRSRFCAFALTVLQGIRRSSVQSSLCSSVDTVPEPGSCRSDASDVSYVRVCAIVPQSSVMIYDLTVPVTQCYFGDNGILHHNSGKDYLCSKLAAYIAYVVNSMAVDPASYITSKSTKLAVGTRLDMVNVAPNEDLALNVYFAYLKRWMSHELLWQFHPLILTEDVYFFTAEEIQLAKEHGRKPNPFLAVHSRHSRSAGLDGFNLLQWTMDEADVFLSTDKKDNADDIHKIFRSSANTRMGAGWTGVVISYPRTKKGFVKRIAERARKNMDEFGANAIYFHDLAATWVVRPTVSRNDPAIAEEYRNDPVEAAALYECIPMEVVDAFFDFPDLIDAAVDYIRQPVADIVTEAFLEGERHYVRARIAERSAPLFTPGYTYFMSGDGGAKKDAFGLCICHVDNASDAFTWLCPECVRAAPTLLSGADYKHMPLNAREPVNAGESGIYCPICFRTAEEYAGTFQSGSVSVRNWYRRSDRDESTIYDSSGNAFNIGHIYEDLLIQVVPQRKQRFGEVDAPVHFPSMQTLCRELIGALSITTTRFDPWQTIEMTQGLLSNPGGDIGEISYSNPEQYKRAKLAKAVLHAGLWHSLPNKARDTEWKELQRMNGNKIDHPVGGSKDLYDVEAVCIWLAASHKMGQASLTWG
jgi:hypothetical protein